MQCCSAAATLISALVHFANAVTFSRFCADLCVAGSVLGSCRTGEGVTSRHVIVYVIITWQETPSSSSSGNFGSVPTVPASTFGCFRFRRGRRERERPSIFDSFRLQIVFWFAFGCLRLQTAITRDAISRRTDKSRAPIFGYLRHCYCCW